MKKIFVISFIALLIFSCNKPERDNPLDVNSPNTDNNGLIFDSYTIVFDDNSDGIANKGELVCLKVYIKNNSTVIANGVTAIISTTNSYISNLSPNTYVEYNNGSVGYNDIGSMSKKYGYAGIEGYQYYTVKFKIDDTTPSGTIIKFNLKITDNEGNISDEEFSLIVDAISADLLFEKFYIVSDDNNDGIANKGESVFLKVYIKNYGSSTVNGVKGIITTSSSYISGLSPSASIEYNSGSIGYNDIGSMSEKYGYAGIEGAQYYSVKFDVNEATPDGTKLKLNLEINDENANTWNDSFELTVYSTSALLNFDSFTIVSDDNDDGIADRGEHVFLKVYVKNNGSSNANGVKAAISTSSSYISALSPLNYVEYNNGSVGYNDISPMSKKYGYAGMEGYQYYTVNFIVNSTTPLGEVIPFNIQITDNNSNVWDDVFYLNISSD